HLGRQALLVADRRLRAEGERARRRADVHAVPAGRLDDHVGRRVGDLRLLAADDAADRDRPVRVRDDEHARPQLSRLAVEAQDALALARLPDVQLPAGELRGVEHMRRFAVLEHHVGGRVDHVADRAHAGGAEAALNPLRAGADLDARDRHRDEPRAEVGNLDRDVDELRRRRRHALDVGRHEVGLELAPRRCGELARDPHVAQAVGPVRRDLGFEDRLARDVLAERLARLSAVEQHDPRLGILTEEQLVRGAEHALGGLAGDLAVTPGSATGTSVPAFAFGAPAMIWMTFPPPTSTWWIHRGLFERGWSFCSRTRPTMIAERSVTWTDSIFVPDIVSRCAASCGERPLVST